MMINFNVSVCSVVRLMFVKDVTLKYTTDHEGVSTRREAKGLDPHTLLSKLEGARKQLREQALAVQAAAAAAAAREGKAKS